MTNEEKKKMIDGLLDGFAEKMYQMGEAGKESMSCALNRILKETIGEGKALHFDHEEIYKEYVIPVYKENGDVGLAEVTDFKAKGALTLVKYRFLFDDYDGKESQWDDVENTVMVASDYYKLLMQVGNRLSSYGFLGIK